METARYTHEPPPVLADPPCHGLVRYTVNANPRQIDNETWEAEQHTFWEAPGNVDVEAMRQNPGAWLNYIPQYIRQAAQEQVDAWNDTMFSTKTDLPCPLGFSVQYSPKAVTLAAAISGAVSLGVRDKISWTDAQNVRHDLTLDEFKQVAAVIDAHVDGLQSRADAARDAIRAATTEAEIRATLATLHN